MTMSAPRNVPGSIRVAAGVAAPRSAGPAPTGAIIAGLAPVIVLFASISAIIPAYLFRESANDLVIAGTSLVALLAALAYRPFSIQLFRWSTPFSAMAIMICAYVFIALLHREYLVGLKTILQVSLSFSCFVVGIMSAEAGKRYPQIDRNLLVAAIICYVGIMTAALIVPYQTENLPKNSIGGSGMYLAALIAAMRYARTNKVVSLLWLVPLMMIPAAVSGHRLVLGLGPIAFIALVMMWNFRNRSVQRGLVYAAAVVSVLSVYMYVQSASISSFASWNSAVEELSGRQINSGRQLIWGPVYAAIERHPWGGNGLAVNMIDLTGLNLSTHNAFLLVALQVGLAGLVPLIGVLLTLCWSATRGAYSPWGTYFSLLLSMAIIHNTFEAALIQNNFPIASLIWLTLGIIGGRLKTLGPPTAGHMVRSSLTRPLLLARPQPGPRSL